MSDVNYSSVTLCDAAKQFKIPQGALITSYKRESWPILPHRFFPVKENLWGNIGRPLRCSDGTINHFQTKPKLLVISGPSGSGKSTILRKMFSEFPDQFGFSVSHTTRAPRPGEMDGVHYHFTPRDKFEKMIENGEFLESDIYTNNLYGTSKAAVEKVWSEGKICVLDIGTQGISRLKSTPNLESVYVLIKPPSLEVLEKRLRDRKTDSEESIRRRLEVAESELKYASDEDIFNLVIVNDDLELAYRQFRDFIVETFLKNRTLTT